MKILQCHSSFRVANTHGTVGYGNSERFSFWWRFVECGSNCSLNRAWGWDDICGSCCSGRGIVKSWVGVWHLVLRLVNYEGIQADLWNSRCRGKYGSPFECHFNSNNGFIALHHITASFPLRRFFTPLTPVTSEWPVEVATASASATPVVVPEPTHATFEAVPQVPTASVSTMGAPST